MKLILCLLVIIHHSQSSRVGPTILSTHGLVEGTIETSVLGEEYAAFKGIPYAEPPVGALRFRDPLPARKWGKKLIASNVTAHCLQLGLLFMQRHGNEDCLYLDVYTPMNPNTGDSTPKSVMVWMKGFTLSNRILGPDFLIAKDVVVVIVNHRVGLLGFLNVDDEAAAGNQGLKDQVLALKWVRDNIAHFKGDPNSVTIFGVGDGASYVHHLALSPLAHGLYHKVIAQSGTALNPGAHAMHSSKSRAQKLAAALGLCTKDPKALIAFLSGISVTSLNEQLVKDDQDRLFLPTVDDKSKEPFFPVPLSVAAHRGVQVPFLLGDVSLPGMTYLLGMNEEKWFFCGSHLEKCIKCNTVEMLNNKEISIQMIRQFYFDISTVREGYVQMHTDLQYTYGIHDTVAIQVLQNSPTYMYRFSYDDGRSFVKIFTKLNIKAVGFAEDVKYVFNNRPSIHFLFTLALLEPTTKLVIDRITQMWTDFAKTGNPTPDNTTLVPVKWEPIKDADMFDFMDISENLQMKRIENINNRKWISPGGEEQNEERNTTATSCVL